MGNTQYTGQNLPSDPLPSPQVAFERQEIKSRDSLSLYKDIIDRELKKFGHQELRPIQEEVIPAVLEGRDVLLSERTGGGKSLCYQLPAMILPGVTVVVSPLIALIKDQVDALEDTGLRVGFLNSTLTTTQQRKVMQGLEFGDYDILYVTPERLSREHFREEAVFANINLVAVDEAHCTSLWGHSFRPEYGMISDFLNYVGNPPVIALTATAPEFMREEIIENLGLRDPLSITGKVRRTEIDISKIYCATPEAKSEKLEELLTSTEHEPGSTIVYFATVLEAERHLHMIAPEVDCPVSIYTGQLDGTERDLAQDQFANGESGIMFCTNAFGMGVDIKSVRRVIHFDMTASVEAYAQEIGRAARDGLPAQAVLLWGDGDIVLQRSRYHGSNPKLTDVFAAYKRICSSIPQELIPKAADERNGLTLRFKFPKFIGSYNRDSYTSDSGEEDLFNSCVAIMQGAGMLGPEFSFADKEGEMRRYCNLTMHPYDIAKNGFPVTEAMIDRSRNIDLMRLAAVEQFLSVPDEKNWDFIEQYFQVSEIKFRSDQELLHNRIENREETIGVLLDAIREHNLPLGQLSRIVRGTSATYKSSEYYNKLQDTPPKVIREAVRDLTKAQFILIHGVSNKVRAELTETGLAWLEKHKGTSSTSTSYTKDDLLKYLREEEAQSIVREQLRSQLADDGMPFDKNSPEYYAVGFLKKTFVLQGENVTGKKIVAALAGKSTRAKYGEGDAALFLKVLFPELTSV